MLPTIGTPPRTQAPKTNERTPDTCTKVEKQLVLSKWLTTWQPPLARNIMLQMDEQIIRERLTSSIQLCEHIGGLDTSGDNTTAPLLLLPKLLLLLLLILQYYHY